MSPLALVLVLASASLHATWNLFAKRAGASTRGPAFVFSFSALTALLYAPLALSQGGWAFAQIGLAGGVAVLGSAVLHIGYFLSLQRGYRVGDLSLVYPIARGGGPLLATLGAIAWFGERPSGVALAGTGLVVLATITLASGRSQVAGSLQRLAPGLAWGAVTAAFIGSYTLWDARAVAIVGVPPLLYLWWTELLRAALLAPLALSRPADLRQVWQAHRGAVLVIALLSPFTYLLVLIAFTMAPVSLVAPIREVSVLIGAWLGVSLLGEGHRIRRLIAAAAMVLGVVLLTRG